MEVSNSRDHQSPEGEGLQSNSPNSRKEDSHETMDRILPYCMLKDCQYEADDDRIKEFEETLVAFVEGNIDTATAAKQLTDTICDQVATMRRLADPTKEHSSYPIPVSIVTIGIGSIASCFPPSHVTQEKLMELINAFTTLEPKREVLSPLVDNNGDLLPSHIGSDYESQVEPVILWTSIKQLSFDSDLLWLGDEGRSHSRGVDKAYSEEQARWRNLSFFYARLSAEGIADHLGHMSALFMLQPVQQLSKTSSRWSGYLAAQALAGAQWIVPEGHGAWVWRQCKTHIQTRSPSVLSFTVEHWNQWKEAFTEVAGLHDDPNVPEIARELSSTALEVMGRLESDDPVA